MNPYEVLGVATDAGAAVIRNAFRRRSKAAHPDAGGSDEAFNALRLAHDVLLDPERRRRFDETGEVQPTEADNAAAAALAVIAEAMSLAMAMEGDPAYLDFPAKVGEYLRSQVHKIDADLANLPARRQRALDLATRLRPPEGEIDPVGAILRAKAAEIDMLLRKAQFTRAAHQRAIEIIERYRFERKAQRVQGWGLFGQMNTATT